MEISLLSDRYLVRRLTENDIAKIYSLCKNNPLYYHYCPPFVTYASIASDMKALPPNKDYSDKYYLGYYQGEKLIAVMDLILSYPDENTAFIGFFMMNRQLQGHQIGTSIIQELCLYLKETGLKRVLLGIDKENPQSNAFWAKNGFSVIREVEQEDGTILLAEKCL